MPTEAGRGRTTGLGYGPESHIYAWGSRGQGEVYTLNSNMFIVGLRAPRRPPAARRQLHLAPSDTVMAAYFAEGHDVERPACCRTSVTR